MTNENAQPQSESPIANDSSDGSELIPAEVQANIRHNDDQPTSTVAIPGTTVDDEGLINNFATEPKVYPATYPSSRQQSGKGGGFRYGPLPPLRTVRTTFTVYGSSNLNRSSMQL